ncbi:MAG: hypothetical protein KC708_02580 [Anaerolineae bacterium]|nr:hypothetical protein [Anaerolineae bacterium]
MQAQPAATPWNRIDWHIAIALAVALFSVYLITYSANIESGDSLQYMDVVSSLARFGDLRRDESFYHGQKFQFSADDQYPLKDLNISGELSVHLAVPLYHLGDALGLGLVHTVWLFNPILTTLTAIFMYGIARSLKYGRWTSALAMLAFGLCTLVWPYTKSFFRDPPVMLGFAIALWGFVRWQGQKEWRYALVGIIGVVLAIGAKLTAGFAMPGLLILALPLPAVVQRIGVQRVLLGLLVAAFAALTVLIYNETLFNAVASLLPFNTSYSRIALHSYLYSLGGSIWGTSPILILGLFGIGYGYRQRQMQTVCGILLIVLGYAVGYALLSGPHWFGGLSWPPRFLLPTVPFLLLLILPALRWAGQVRRYWPLTLLVITLALYSLWIQWWGVVLPWNRYPDILEELFGEIISWLPGLNDPQFFRWVLLRDSLGPLGYDFAWYRSGLDAWPIAFGGLAIAAVLWAIFAQRVPRRVRGLGLPIVVGALAVVTVAGLSALRYQDPLFRAKNEALRNAMSTIEQESLPGEMVFTTDTLYELFILNENRSDNARYIILPQQPGESPSPQQAAERISTDPIDLLFEDTLLALNYALEHTDRVWLLASNGPSTSWARRPIEQYLAQYAYVVREVDLQTENPTVRLLEIATTAPPSPRQFVSPEHATDIIFGRDIALNGYTLPAGTEYRAGEVVPISLQWRPSEIIASNFTVVMFLAAEDGFVVTQSQDRWPQMGFSPTSAWQPDVPVWDHHAIQLPAQIQPGEYQGWLALYDSSSGEVVRLPVTRGPTTQEGTAADLLRITVTAP